MSVYENVVNLANKKNMKIAELERKAELGNGTIGKWQDEKNKPSLNSIEKVANALNVKVQTLLRD